MQALGQGAVVPCPLQLTVWPSPLESGKLHIDVSWGSLLSAQTAVWSVAVYDMAGRRLQEVAGGRGGLNGTSSLTWNAASIYGTRMASGVYVVRVSVDGRSVARRAIVLGR